MSDLISRSEMIKAIEEHYINLTNDNVPRSIPDFYSEMQKLVYNQPTAFDTEKVVAELEQQAEQYRERGFETERKNVKVMVTMADRYYAKQCSYLHASEIVKRGGVDD